MRKTIRQILVDNILQVEGRVYEPHAAGPTTKKPYLVLKEGVQDPEADWSAFSTIVEVWPYVSRTTFQQVDALASAIIDTLHRARLSNAVEEYLVDYLGSAGQDFVDAEWDAITRGLRFQVFALGWLDGQTFKPDPIAALRMWTEGRWKENYPLLQTDPAQWLPSDQKPALYWRLVRLVPTQVTAAVSWLEAQISGHLLAPGVAVRLEWVRKITEGMSQDRRIKLSDGSPLYFERVTADIEADPMRRGQIQLVARFGVLQPAAKYKVLQRAVVSGDISGEAKNKEVK